MLTFEVGIHPGRNGHYRGAVKPSSGLVIDLKEPLPFGEIFVPKKSFFGLPMLLMKSQMKSQMTAPE